MVLLFKGIAPPSQFPATIASGAPPKPNHACFQRRVDVCSETRWRSKGGRGLFAPHALRLSQKKKSSLRALRAHNERTYTSGTSCAGTRCVPFVGCSSSGSQNMGDGSGGEDGGEEGRPNSTCPRDDQSSPHHHSTHRLSDALFSFRPREERLAASCLLPASRWTSTAASDNPPP